MTHSSLSTFRAPVSLSALLLVAASAIAAPLPKKVTVGSLTLTRCNAQYQGYCGSIKRALDPTGDVGGKVTIGFEYYPRNDRDRPALGTIVPQEGGPGYSSTGTRDAYLNIFAPLRERRDILIVDKRGTGTSGAIDCPEIQSGDPNDPQAIKACGRQLGKTAPLYGTDLAVADIVAVLDALHIGKIDFYGDSYGTYVGQVFAAFFPERLRTLILDSAYPVRPPDVWFPTDWATGRDGLDLVCERSPSCRALGGRSTQRIEALLNALRNEPISGIAPDSDGIPQDTTVDVTMLFLLMTNLGNSPVTYRDLDAATRAWFDTGDALPLLRLAAEYNTAFISDAVDFSYGQYQALVCAEYPLHYDLDDTPAQRRRQYQRAIHDAREHRADLFAPFTIDEALASNANFTPLATCLDWPRPSAAWPQGDPLPAHPVFPAVPTLVLSGDLDSVTSPQDAAQVVELFPDVVHLVVPNLTHVTAWTFSDAALLVDGGDLTHCVQRIVRRFVTDRSTGDTSCVHKVRPLRTPPRFARSVGELAPARALHGNEGGNPELRLAAGALETVGDVIARFFVTFGIGSGLRGGEFTYTLEPHGYDFRLKRVRWTEDLQVSGSIRWDQGTDAITADVRLRQAGRNVGRIEIAWDDGKRNAVATMNGTINGQRIEAERIAP